MHAQPCLASTTALQPQTAVVLHSKLDPVKNETRSAWNAPVSAAKNNYDEQRAKYQRSLKRLVGESLTYSQSELRLMRPNILPLKGTAVSYKSPVTRFKLA